MEFRGWHKTSLIEYPDTIATVVFTAGCNFRCRFCHNPELVLNNQQLPAVPQRAVLEFLAERRGLYQALVVSGGEPTLHDDLPAFLSEVKRVGLLTGIETNGTNPEMLGRLIDTRTIDYVAMDIKTVPTYEAYPEVTRVDDPSLVDRVNASIQLLLSASVVSEFRTTLVDRLHSQQVVRDIAQRIEGAKRYVLQQFVPRKSTLDCLDDQARFPTQTLLRIRSEVASRFEACEVRNL